jgi:hypothetical protein
MHPFGPIVLLGGLQRGLEVFGGLVDRCALTLDCQIILISRTLAAADFRGALLP